MSLAYHFSKRCYVRIGSFDCETGALPKIVKSQISGLLTYVAAQADEAGVGFGIACAIGLHNIPEGFAVAMPIYIGTKSRSRAMFYGEHFSSFFFHF